MCHKHELKKMKALSQGVMKLSRLQASAPPVRPPARPPAFW